MKIWKLTMNAAPIRPLPASARAPAQRASGTGRISFKSGPADNTKLDRLYQHGCAKVRLPRVYGSKAAEAVLINSSGGLTGGDEMHWHLSCATGSHAVATTQACEKIYKSTGGEAKVTTSITLAPQSRLDWLPQETILFDQARLARNLNVNLQGKARFLALEAVLLGRLAMGEQVRQLRFSDHWTIFRDGKLTHKENLKLDGNVSALGATTPVLNGHLAFATLCHIGPETSEHLDHLSNAIRTLLDCHKAVYGGVSAFSGKLLVRMTAPTGLELREALIPIINILRAGEPLPRVWTT